MRITIRLFLLPLLILASACSRGLDPCQVDDEPLTGLLCPGESEVFTPDFWTGEAQDDSLAWNQAVRLCSERFWPEGTRCDAVSAARSVLVLEQAAEEIRKRYLAPRADSEEGFTGLPFDPQDPPEATGNPLDRDPRRPGIVE